MNPTEEAKGRLLEDTDSSGEATRSDLIVVDDVRRVPARTPQVDRSIFEDADRFRPVFIGSVLALAALVAYATVSLISLLTTAPTSSHDRVVSVPSVSRVVASHGVALAPGEGCRRIEGAVFIDDVADGVRTSEEEGLAGIGVAAVGTDGEVLAIATTAADGGYTLILPAALTAVIDLDLAPQQALDMGLWPGPRLPQHRGGEQLLDREPCLAFHGMRWINSDGRLPTVARSSQPSTSSSAATEAGESAGLPAVQLHGRIWLDQDEDVVFDPPETGLAAVRVELLGEDGSLLGVATTGTDGLYSFSNLGSNRRYTVRVDGTDQELLGVNALGNRLADRSEPIVTLQTGDGGLAVWGIDFSFAAD